MYDFSFFFLGSLYDENIANVILRRSHEVWNMTLRRRRKYCNNIISDWLLHLVERYSVGRLLGLSLTI